MTSPSTGAIYTKSPDIRLNDLEHQHWRRHQRSLHCDVGARDADDLEAFARLNRTNSDYLQWRRGQPIKAFKIDPDHWTLLEMGCDLGLDELTSEELADCFDMLCPCGLEFHEGDALKKQRGRVRKSMRQAKDGIGDTYAQ